MAAVTVRNLPPSLVRSLKTIAGLHGRSMEQEIREILERTVGDKLSAMAQIEASWAEQARRPTAEEIDAWIDEGRVR